MESKVKNANYIMVQGWMLKKLNLKGNELLIFAIIYGFSQAEGQTYSGGLQYLADWTNSTKQGVVKCLKSLEDKGFISKTESGINGQKKCYYIAISETDFDAKTAAEQVSTVSTQSEKTDAESTADHTTKFNGTIQQSLTPHTTKFNGTVKQSLPNNIYDNKHDITTDISLSAEIGGRKKKKFVAPSLDEVKAYIEQNGLRVNPDKFFASYEASGWCLSNGRKMIDWQAQARVWHQNALDGLLPQHGKAYDSMHDPRDSSIDMSIFAQLVNNF